MKINSTDFLGSWTQFNYFDLQSFELEEMYTIRNLCFFDADLLTYIALVSQDIFVSLCALLFQEGISRSHNKIRDDCLHVPSQMLFFAFTTPTGLLLQCYVYTIYYILYIYLPFISSQKLLSDEQKENCEISPHFFTQHHQLPSSHITCFSTTILHVDWNERNFPFHFFNVKQRAIAK